MKTKKLDLDIDSIGGLSSLTLAEEKALSDFFQKKKLTKKKTEKKKLILKNQNIPYQTFDVVDTFCFKNLAIR